jgi:hypothetical protein
MPRARSSPRFGRQISETRTQARAGTALLYAIGAVVAPEPPSRKKKRWVEVLRSETTNNGELRQLFLLNSQPTPAARSDGAAGSALTGLE